MLRITQLLLYAIQAIYYQFSTCLNQEGRSLKNNDTRSTLFTVALDLMPHPTQGASGFSKKINMYKFVTTLWYFSV